MQSRPKSQKGRRVNAVEIDSDDYYAFVITIAYFGEFGL